MYHHLRDTRWDDIPLLQLRFWQEQHPDKHGKLQDHHHCPLNTVHLPVNVGVSLIDGVHVELLEDPPGKEKPNAVGCGIVGQTNLHSIPIQGD